MLRSNSKITNGKKTILGLRMCEGRLNGGDPQRHYSANEIMIAYWDNPNKSLFFSTNIKISDQYLDRISSCLFFSYDRHKPDASFVVEAEVKQIVKFNSPSIPEGTNSFVAPVSDLEPAYTWLELKKPFREIDINDTAELGKYVSISDGVPFSVKVKEGRFNRVMLEI